eukprot:gene20858-22909_t
MGASTTSSEGKFHLQQGFPEIWQSDNGSEFVAETVKMPWQSNGINIKHSRIDLFKEKPKAQAQLWPCMLPGIVNVISNSWQATTDDIPFRVYRGRGPININFAVVPDDEELVKICEHDSKADKFDEEDMELSVTVTQQRKRVWP